MITKPDFRCGLAVLGTLRIRYGWHIFYHCLRRPYGTSTRHKSLTDDLKMVRNVGIMAHIDAGKTTTTERMLYYAGMIDYPGEVHHGDTVTDFLPQERERGITIQSAVVSFPWQEDYRINLIDTPGHVDFTYEVERSVRAVDSAVAILDASAGVEAQTLTVWRQATENKLPRMIYLNKMDKNTASVKMCLESIKQKLKAEPILLQLAVYSKDGVIGKNSGIIGIVDLVQMKKIIFDPETKGKRTKTISALEDEDILKRRQELVEQVADFDATLATTIIENESITDITNDQLDEAIKRITLDGQVVPVVLGSSYKNVGVQQVLDCIIKYLPHPGEVAKREKVVMAYGDELCGFVFKTLHDKQLGPLTFLRMFSGALKSGDKIYNVSKSKQEKIQKVFQPLANDLKEVHFVGPGQVTVVSGLKETFTGDTITSSSSAASSAKSRLSKKYKDFNDLPVIPGVSVPEPVFFCSIEPASLSHQKLLEEALICLQREDPSLKVNTDPDTGQTVLSGMGELHIEIIHDRLKKEYKVDADLGKLSVAYKETILEAGSKRIDFERRLSDQTHKVGIELSLTPKDNATWNIVRAPGKEVQENLKNLKDRQERCIQNGVDSAFRFGPKLGFPLMNVKVLLYAFEASKYTSEAIIAAAAASCVRQILEETTVVLLEPIVDLFITVDERSQSVVMDDLNRRRFLLNYIDIHQGNKIITGSAPLAELMGYSTALRTISSGFGTYTMQFSHYQKVMNRMEEENIISAMRMSLLRMGNDPRIMEPPAYVSWPSDGSLSSWEVKLHRAVLGGKIQKIKDLAARGGNVDALNDSGQTALFCAAFRGSAEVVNILLSLGAKPNTRCQPEGYTAVHGACYNGDPYVLKRLLQSGGDLRICDSQRRTPLDWAKLQADPTRSSSVRNVVDSARLCTTETSGMEMMKEIQNNLSPRSSTVLSDMMRNIFRKSVIIRDSKSRLGVHVNMDELQNSIHHTGFGKVYYGTGERCAAVIGLPYVSEVSDLEDEGNEEVPSWMCGKFTSFNPKYWNSRKTLVTTREIYHDAGLNAVPDILIQDLEARNKLHHPNLLMLLGVCQTNSGDSISLVYERVSLGSLFSVLHVEQKKLSHRFATDIVIQMCDALEYIHAMKMIHCGISSHSIVLVSHGITKLSCFEYALPENIHGEAAMSSRHPVLTSDSHVNVLKHWMAPEVILKNQYSVRSDVYSLVCVMWELCEGDIPWRSFSLQNLRQVFTNESKQLLPIDKSSTPKYWYNVMDVGLRPNRETRDLELQEIKDMMRMSKKPANPYVYSKGSLASSFGRISPDYGTMIADRQALQIDEVDGQDFNKVVEHIRTSDREEVSRKPDEGRGNSPSEPQGILKKFGRSKPSATIMVESSEARLTEELEKESSSTQTSEVQSIETQTDDTIGSHQVPMGLTVLKPVDSTPPPEAKRPGAIFSLGAGWMKPKPVASSKAIATQTEVRSIRMRKSTSSSNSTISPVTSPTSASTPLWDSLNGSKASNNVQTNVMTKKSQDSFKEKLAKLLETRHSNDHSASSFGSFRSMRKLVSIKPASHCSTGMFSAEEVPVPDLRNYMGTQHLCPSEPYGDKAIKPAGHSLGLELHGKVIPRKSRSHLDLPEIEQEEPIHPGFVIETIEKFNSHSEMLGKPTEFQRQRVPWEHPGGGARGIRETRVVSNSKEKKDCQSEIPCCNSGTDIAIQCMMYDNGPIVNEGQLRKSKAGFTEKRDTWSQSTPSNIVLTNQDFCSPANSNFRKSISVTEVFGRAELPVENPNFMQAEGPERKSKTSFVEVNISSVTERKFEGAATRASMVHDANGDTMLDDVLYLTAQMSPSNSPSINKGIDDLSRGEADVESDHAMISGGIEQNNGVGPGGRSSSRRPQCMYGQSLSFTYGSGLTESKKMGPNHSY